MKTIVDRALVYGRMIKFSHSVFALPFALASAAVAANGRVPWRELPWIVVAMIGARSAAMGFNRLADQAIDARNPRTAGRELPRGVLSRGEVWMFVGASALALIGAAAMLNPLCLLLSPVALLVVLIRWSRWKRGPVLLGMLAGAGLPLLVVAGVQWNAWHDRTAGDLTPNPPYFSMAASVSPPPASEKARPRAMAWASARVPSPNCSNSNTPTGPFQMTVPAACSTVA